MSISATTRAPRPGEREGVEYFFKSREAFEQMITKGELIEYACYVNNYYGTPKAYVEKKLKEGQDVILEIEIQGARKIKEQFPDVKRAPEKARDRRTSGDRTASKPGSAGI